MSHIFFPGGRVREPLKAAAMLSCPIAEKPAEHIADENGKIVWISTNQRTPESHVPRLSFISVAHNLFT